MRERWGLPVDREPSRIRTRAGRAGEAAEQAGEAAEGAGEALLRMHRVLVGDHGSLGWWPGRTRFEIIAGAILTQNTAWRNVESALARLRALRALNVEALERLPEEELALAIRSSGYFRQKARKLKGFVAYVRERYDGRLARMAATPTERLREELLNVWGIGPETADSILLYAFGRPVFVVDAYTHRVLRRHGLHPGGGYEAVRAWVERVLPADAALYNDLHAQIVWVGHRFCGTRPRCDACPLAPLLPSSGPLLD